MPNPLQEARIPEGFQFATAAAGLVNGDRPDLLLAVAERASPASAMFTRNAIVAAPVALSREHLRQTDGLVRAILVNAGSANACTGEQGDEDAMQCAAWVAELVGCDVLEVLVFSTGVIGQRLAMDKIEARLGDMHAELSSEAATIDAASRAILTTDLVPKITSRVITLEDDSEAQLLGLAKGSGMIHPDMATMLGFFFTDFDLGAGSHILLRGAVEESFHRITVDGDTSTNDAVLLWSSCAREGLAPQDEFAFFHALRDMAVDLGRAIARDGEGASKLIEVRVLGALTPDDATKCARTIAGSSLVRTAVHGEDPNWGRILAAAGRSGARIETRKLRAGIGDVCLFEKDEPCAENEPAAAAHLASKEILLWVDLGAGECDSTCWSCDLTADYIRINADYRS